MKYNRLGYLIGEGFSNVFKNKKSTIASIIIMCATMIIFGLFLIIGENVNHFVDNLKLQQGFQVFMKENATQEEMDQVKEDIRALDGISTIEFVSKEQGLNTMKEKLKDEKGVLDGFNVQKIKASYIVKVTDLERSKTIQDEVEKIDNVVKITNSNETAMKLISIAKIIRIATGVILLLLIIISTFIISNTIKLTVHARRKEISIMKYVGATNSFIRWPFLVEGIIIGVVAGAISVGIIGLAYTYIVGQISGTSFFEIANIKFIEFSSMSELLILVYLGLGIGVGAIGSTISMKKYLEV